MKRLRELLDSDPEEGQDQEKDTCLSGRRSSNPDSAELPASPSSPHVPALTTPDPEIPLRSWPQCLAEYFDACMDQETMGMAIKEVEIITSCSGTDSPIIGLQAAHKHT